MWVGWWLGSSLEDKVGFVLSVGSLKNSGCGAEHCVVLKHAGIRLQSFVHLEPGVWFKMATQFFYQYANI